MIDFYGNSRPTPLSDLIRLYFAKGGGGGGPAKKTITDPEGSVNFSTNVAKPIEIAVAFSPMQNDSDEQITGYTGAKVTRTGRNLFDKEHPNVRHGYFDTSTGVIVASSSHRIVYIPCKSNTTYISSKVAVNSGNADRFHVGWTDEETVNTGTTIYDRKGRSSGFVAGERYSYSVTTGDNATYLVIWLSRNTEYADSLQTLQIEVGETDATDYEAYNGFECAITFPNEAGTVYGGTLTNNGTNEWELVVDKGMVDLGTLTWTYYSAAALTNPIFYGDVSDGKTYAAGDTISLLCSNYSAMSVAQSAADFSKEDDKTIGANAQPNLSATRILVRDTAYTTAAAFKTAMSGVGLVYELRTPATYTITASQVKSLIGTNNVFHNLNGDITVKFYEKE